MSACQTGWSTSLWDIRGQISSSRKSEAAQEGHNQFVCDAERLNADFRGRVTCLIPTQFRSLTRPFFLVFSGFEHGDLGVV